MDSASKFVRTAALASIVAVAIGGGATRTHAAEPTQVVGGRIVVPTGPRTAGPVWLGACGLLAGTAHFVADAEEAFELRFTVDPGTYGDQFTLRPAQPADLDISFSGPGSETYFERRTVTGEYGLVPPGATTATICLVAGPPAAFRYQAG
jgi:hypothetical protein